MTARCRQYSHHYWPLSSFFVQQADFLDLLDPHHRVAASLQVGMERHQRLALGPVEAIGSVAVDQIAVVADLAQWWVIQRVPDGLPQDAGLDFVIVAG